MQTKVGTPEDARIRERKWHERLSEIEERLKSFQTPPRFKLSSPENTQVGEEHMILLDIVQTLVCVVKEIWYVAKQPGVGNHLICS